MIAQASCMNTWRHKIMTERIHLEQWRHPHCIAKVVGIDALGQTRTGHRFGGQKACLESLLARFANKRKSQSFKITATTYPTTPDIRIIIRQLKLKHPFLPTI